MQGSHLQIDMRLLMLVGLGDLARSDSHIKVDMLEGTVFVSLDLWDSCLILMVTTNDSDLEHLEYLGSFSDSGI